MIRACHRFRVLFTLMFVLVIGLSPDMAASGLFRMCLTILQQPGRKQHNVVVAQMRSGQATRGTGMSRRKRKILAAATKDRQNTASSRGRERAIDNAVTPPVASNLQDQR
jgi:hypothetical protein